MTIAVVSGAQVRELLPMSACVELMRRAHAMVANNETIMPVRQGVRAPGARGLLGLMPGYTSSPSWYGAKILSVFEGNFGTGRASHQGMVLLFDPLTGEPKAMIEASAITAIRTAASSAVATDVLANPQTRSLGVMGYGEQAARHIEALQIVRTFERILVWGRDYDRCVAFARAQGERFGCSIEAVTTPEEAAGADVVCTTTSASEPYYQAAWLKAGQHLNLVGASTPREAEAEPAVIGAAKCYYDSREGALALAGEFIQAREAGAITEADLLGSVGEVITDKIQGRRSYEDITLFKSLGLVVQDIVAADFVLQEALRKRVAQLLDW